MNRARVVATLLLLVTLALPTPARAQSQGWGEWGGDWSSGWGDTLVPYAMGVLAGGAYVLGGIVSFAVLDARYAARRRPFPIALTATQLAYGSALVGVGGVLLNAGEPELGTTVMVLGGTVAAVPLVEASLRAGRRRRAQTTLGFTPTGVVLSGTF